MDDANVEGIRDLPLETLTVDDEVSQRANGIVSARVSEYTAALKQGARFPAIDVFFDGEIYWLADGFHRLAASAKLELDSISASIHSGSRDDAIVFATGANADHGARRTNADKRLAVATLLGMPAWEGESDRAIARHTGCTQPFVSKLRKLSPAVRAKKGASPADNKKPKQSALERAWARASKEQRVEWLKSAGPEILEELEPFGLNYQQYSLWD